MPRQSKNRDEPPLLFDLPLAEPAPEHPSSGRRPPIPPPDLELATEVDLPVRTGPVPVPSAGPRVAQPKRQGFVPRRSRLLAGLGDILVHAAVVVAAAVGARLLEVEAALADWPAFAALLLSFSFLYTVIPLAFWGHTPGMAWAGLSTHNPGGDPLTFDQTFRRWIGGLLTLALLGMPLVLAPGRRGLSDWLSGSATYRAAG
jgi:uncharacterized RDD family membrane protein YckC